MRLGAGVVLLLAFTLGACRATRDGQSTLRDEANPLPMTEFDAPPEVPEPFVSLNGFEIARFEYWPFVWKEAEGACAFPYPDLVEHGFDGGTPAARTCMKQAYDRLWYILKNPSPDLQSLRDKVGPRVFFILVYDYSKTKTNPAGEPVASCLAEPQHRQIWHHGRPGGVIMWVNELNKDGSCGIRTAAELAAFVGEELKRVK
jgi:hypothetical protein